MTRKKFIIKAAILTAIAVAIPFICNEKLTVTHYTVHTGKLSSPVRIAFLSDFHNTTYGSGVSELIQSVDALEPDAVVFGGDLFNYVWNEKNSQLLIKSLVQRYPCYYALGNHEYKRGQQDLIRRETAALGVTVLDGKYSDLRTNAGTVRFIGIEGTLTKDHFELAKKAVSEDVTNVLINHYPEEFPKLAGCGFDLILSGHAHGGMWRFPPLINGVYSPGEGLFPHYVYGVYSDGGTSMIVSSGLQRCVRDLVIPRVFNRPEIVALTLEP